jgi:Flp pilus assembly protein TadG
MRLGSATKVRLRKAIGSEAGTSVVEFAILAPVFIFLLIGLIEVGRYTYFGTLAANAARAGVQYGSQSMQTYADNTGMQNAALNDGQNVPNLAAAASHKCVLSGTNTSCPIGVAAPATNWVYYVEVDTSGTFQPLMQYPGIPRPLQVNAKAVMRVVNQ